MKLGDCLESHYGSTSIRNNHSKTSSTLNQINGSCGRQQFDNQQSQLYQNVLDRLTSRVIDIASIEKSCEQADLTDREQAYRDKLKAIRRQIVLPSNSMPKLSGNEYPQKTKDPIPMEDYKFITEISIKLNNAIEEGFKIHCDEPFVNFT
ncbi:hypothetical protein QR98_0003420 [Sarcoptes scabiei]|uniref:Ragulator complex protein LAMTOR1 n=1 Tax=Sarcoptes scabiei TaxID=52283 RepID=A0A131ZTW2_SARSC|nr:hypothetical protein QR98_0003420 [Sarcoptes scabiei]